MSKFPYNEAHFEIHEDYCPFDESIVVYVGYWVYKGVIVEHEGWKYSKEELERIRDRKLKSRQTGRNND